jgi:hypothetical protein
MKKHVHHLFIDALENQLADEQKLYFYDHLKNCPACAQEFDDLKTVFQQTANTSPPQPEQHFWDQYWLNLQYKLDKPKKSSALFSWMNYFSIERYLKFGLATAAVLILSIGLYFGELRFRIVDEDAAQDIQQTAQSYFERSKILLTSFANLEPDSRRIPNFELQKALSQKLINQSADLRNELDPSAEKRMLSLMDDLEVVLLQIANMDSTYDMNTLELIQYSVEQKSILFKLNLQDVSDIKKETNTKNKDI